MSVYISVPARQSIGNTIAMSKIFERVAAQTPGHEGGWDTIVTAWGTAANSEDRQLVDVVLELDAGFTMADTLALLGCGAKVLKGRPTNFVAHPFL